MIMGYIVNLTVILDDIFRTAAGNVTENAVLKVAFAHVTIWPQRQHSPGYPQLCDRGICGEVCRHTMAARPGWRILSGRSRNTVHP